MLQAAAMPVSPVAERGWGRPGEGNPDRLFSTSQTGYLRRYSQTRLYTHAAFFSLVLAFFNVVLAFFNVVFASLGGEARGAIIAVGGRA